MDNEYSEQAEAEAAEAAYNHAMDEPICICAVCGLITPLCDCQLATERKVNAAHPWPIDPNAISDSAAARICTERGRMRMAIQGGAV